MKKQARVLKYGCMAVMLLCIAIVPFVMVDNAISAEDEEARIPFLLPELKADKMPPVFFSHDKHIAAMEDDCSACHEHSDEFFLDSAKMAEEKKSTDAIVAYVHTSCVSCHATMADKGAATGPLLASCRSCHSESIAAAQAAEAK